jgi:hypothetical protein
MTGALEVFLRKQEQRQAQLAKLKEVVKSLRDCYDSNAKVLEPTWRAILGPTLRHFQKAQFCEPILPQIKGKTILCPDLSSLLSGWKE